MNNKYYKVISVLIICLLSFCYCDCSYAKKKTTTYNVAWHFVGDSYVVKDNMKYGVAVKNGHLILPCEYDKIYKVPNYIVVEKDGKKGIFTTTGKNILPVIYDDINYREGYFIVAVNNKQGLYSINLENYLEVEYDKITIIQDDIFLLKKNSKYFLYNSTKAKMIELPYENISYFDFNLLVEKNGKKGIYSYTDEKLVLPVKYDEIKFNGGSYIVTTDGKKGIIDSKAFKTLLPTIYEDIDYSNNYVILMKKANKKWDMSKIYSENHVTKIAVISVDTDEFSTPKTWVKMQNKLFIPIKNDEKYGLMLYDDNEHTASLILPYEYQSIKQSKWNHLIEKNGKIAIFDNSKQQFVTDFLFDDCERLANTNYFKVKNNGKYALLDLKNNAISEFEYDDIRVKYKFSHDNIQVQKNGKWKYISRIKIIKYGLKHGTKMGLCATVAVAFSPIIVPVGIVFLHKLTAITRIPHAPKKIKVYTD